GLILVLGPVKDYAADPRRTSSRLPLCRHASRGKGSLPNMVRGALSATRHGSSRLAPALSGSSWRCVWWPSHPARAPDFSAVQVRAGATIHLQQSSGPSVTQHTRGLTVRSSRTCFVTPKPCPKSLPWLWLHYASRLNSGVSPHRSIIVTETKFEGGCQC